MRATAVLSRHPHTRWPASFNHEQNSASSYGSDVHDRPGPTLACPSDLFAGGVKSGFVYTLARHFDLCSWSCDDSALDAIPEAYHDPAAVWWRAFAASAVIRGQVVPVDPGSPTAVERGRRVGQAGQVHCCAQLPDDLRRHLRTWLYRQAKSDAVLALVLLGFAPPLSWSDCTQTA